MRHYGEYYIRRSLRLAPGAVVILSRVPYAAGSSEPGALSDTPTAARRADNYAAGFLGAGAGVVFANDRSVASMVRDLFMASRSMRSVFWLSPSASTRYDSTFTSTRTPGSSGILAPYSPGQYYESVVGRLRSTTTDWRRTWTAVRVTSIPALLYGAGQRRGDRDRRRQRDVPREPARHKQSRRSGSARGSRAGPDPVSSAPRRPAA